MTDANADADIYRQAAEFNRNCSIIEGAVLQLPDYGQLVMTGDLHGHRRNFHKLQRFCDLEHAPVRHVILHELIHEEPTSPTSIDTSHALLLEAARWKCEFPEQVHFLQANHEMSQVSGHEIAKGGRVVTYDFEQGVVQAYGSGADRVLEAMMDFLASLPLAARTPNRVFLSHSLPGARTMPDFDPADLAKPVTLESLANRGTAYALVWGRYQTPEILAELAEALDVDMFIGGHQPQDSGYAVIHDRMLILASDHNHGVFLPFDLRRKLTMDDLVRLIRPFSAIA
jgi:hypothetical protein